MKKVIFVGLEEMNRFFGIADAEATAEFMRIDRETVGKANHGRALAEFINNYYEKLEKNA